MLLQCPVEILLAVWQLKKIQPTAKLKSQICHLHGTYFISTQHTCILKV